MMASRGMGAINPKKMPTKKVIHRTDNPDDVDMYKEGGGVNAAGNYTKPGMRKSLFNSIKNSGQPEKRSCLPRGTRPQVEVTKIESAAAIT